MVRFWILAGIIIGVGVTLALLTETDAQGIAHTHFAGMPTVINAGDSEDPAWLVLGGGVGVLVIGAGVGLVVFGIAGAGILFATGQLAAGGICFAQGGLGFSFFCGQGGAGVTAFGQVVGGAVVAGQGALGFDGAEHLRQLNGDLGRILAFR